MAMEFEKYCFVIMPFGEKEVTDEKGVTRKINFDPIYSQIFKPAIEAVPLPESGGQLIPRRTDQDFHTANIAQDMFEYLEYSRMALADITGLNANVLYELGVRHRARQSGTAIFRLPGMKLPFDITQIKAFPYEYEPTSQAEESRAFITKVLTESLKENRLDSPVQIALLAQRESPSHEKIEEILKNAENAIRARDLTSAIAAYRSALRLDDDNSLLHHRLGLLLKDDGQWKEALAEFNAAIAAAERVADVQRSSPHYPEAYREKGIAENKLYNKAKEADRAGMKDGIAALQRAIELNDDDFDAHASLGGALRRAKRFDESLKQYERSVEVSNGHSYPLLNAIKLRAMRDGKLELDSKTKFLLRRAERSLRAQVVTEPPYGAPWSFFDLAEICLYSGDRDGFIQFAERGTESAEVAAWQVESFRDALKELVAHGVMPNGLSDGIQMLTERADYLQR